MGCLLGRLEKEVQSLTSRIYCKSRLIILDIVILLSNSSMDHRIDNNLMVSRIFYSFSPLYPDIYKEKHALRSKIQKLDRRQWISKKVSRAEFFYSLVHLYIGLYKYHLAEYYPR